MTDFMEPFSDLATIIHRQFYVLPGTAEVLVHDFFAAFSRFEYAMKRAGYLKGDENGAEADWDKLGNSLNKKISANASDELAAALDYLTNNPPQKQVVRDHRLSWSPMSRGDNELFSRWILRIVCRVRNNLFHGGKFPLPDGPMAESARDKKLLRSALVVLNACANLDPELNRWFTLDLGEDLQIT